MPYVIAYDTWAVAMERTEYAAVDSFAALLEARRFGIAIAAMVKMMATTIKSSIREKPLTECCRCFCFADFGEARIF
jgi:hypothetical protein